MIGKETWLGTGVADFIHLMTNLTEFLFLLLIDKLGEALSLQIIHPHICQGDTLVQASHQDNLILIYGAY